MAKMIQAPYKTKRYFTNDDNANLIYFQFPKLLMYGERYKKMSSDGKLLYMLCLDLIKLSMEKGWKDEHGRYYIKMSLETIEERMNCARAKAVNLKKELVQHELMEVVRVGLGKADRLYILQLDYTDEDIYKANNDHEGIGNDEETPSETAGALEPQQKFENRTSGSSKIKLPEVRKSNPIKNNFIKINNKNIDDDKKRTSPSGEVSPTNSNESINLVISNLRESTKDDLTKRSFNAVVRKVVDKYNQGEVKSFRDYLVTALVNKIHELEFRRAKNEAKEQLKANKQEIVQEKKQQLESQPMREIVPFYDWLNESVS